MSRLRLHRGLFHFIALFLLASGGPAFAAGPWESLVPFKKIDADPNSMYPVAKENGPWMIMATTFRGDNAEQQARDLVYELRRKHRLPAYTYEKQFDFTKGEQGRGLNPDGTPKRMKYVEAKVVKEVAVLVGDYDTVDDTAAQNLLKKLKYMEPDCLRADRGKSGNAATTNFRKLQQLLPAGSQGRKKGPMGHALVAPNPLLPPEYFNAKGVDKFVLDLNKDLPFSLLDCPGKYTIQVATFSGSVILDQKKIGAAAKGKQTESQLADAAEKAHQLTLALRTAGYPQEKEQPTQRWEAYEYHDRDRSIVCIGSFERLGTLRPDGSLQLDPRVQHIIDTFGNDVALRDPTKPSKAKWLALKGFPLHLMFDITPKAIEVPRRSIGADYQRTMRAERQ